jgi:hypothetical protein
MGFTVPMLLRPGADVGGTRFSGSPAQAFIVLGILGAVFTVGVTTMLYGAWQVRSGSRSLRVVLFLLALFGLLSLIAMVL